MSLAQDNDVFKDLAHDMDMHKPNVHDNVHTEAGLAPRQCCPAPLQARHEHPQIMNVKVAGHPIKMPKSWTRTIAYRMICPNVHGFMSLEMFCGRKVYVELSTFFTPEHLTISQLHLGGWR